MLSGSRIARGSREGDGELALTIPLGVEAPGVARSLVAQSLADQVAPSVLETMVLLVSELVTNSVRHSGGPPEGADVVVRVNVWKGTCRLEVEDPGFDGVITPQPLEPGRGGMGLNLLATVSERWGVVRGAGGPTRVWAQLSCAGLA